MHCEHYLEGIREAAGRLDGVERVTGDPARHLVTITYREGEVEPNGIREAIINRGYRIV